MLNDYSIDIGRNGLERVILDLEEETGIALCGYSGTGKTNIIAHILKGFLERGDVDVTILDPKFNRYYRQYKTEYDELVFYEDGLNKIMVELNNVVKEIKSRVKKLESSAKKSKTLNLDFRKRIVVVDSLSVSIPKIKERYVARRYEKFMENLKYIADEGSRVGVIPVYIFLRNVNSEAPESIVRNLSVKGSFSNPLSDYGRWDLVGEDMKEPKKIGEMLLKSNTYEGFVKTYNLSE